METGDLADEGIQQQREATGLNTKGTVPHEPGYAYRYAGLGSLRPDWGSWGNGMWHNG